tara:strand:- start:449 stop:637 length:189 start_codon:yes stop_codon:yes gene_type:complete
MAGKNLTGQWKFWDFGRKRLGDFFGQGVNTSNEKRISQPMSIPRTVTTLSNKRIETYVIGQA